MRTLLYNYYLQLLAFVRILVEWVTNDINTLDYCFGIFI